MYVSLEEIKQAQAILANIIQPTPLQYSKTFSTMSGNEIFIKPENLQKTGSFKIRGAYNKIFNLSQEERSRGVVAFSAGNHGAGTAYAAKLLGVPATVVMPTNPVPSKRNSIVEYGAKVVDGGATSITMYEKARELNQTAGLAMVHPFDDKFTIAGQGTIGVEIIEELPSADAVIVPVSGGGLIAGIAAAIKQLSPATQVIGVNTEGAMAMYESLKAGRPVEVEKVDTIADGLMAKKPGEITFAHTQKYVDTMVLVSEGEIAKAVAIIAERAKLVVEPSGAAALAAMIFNKTPLTGKNVAVIVSGGNANMKLLATLLEKHL